MPPEEYGADKRKRRAKHEEIAKGKERQDDTTAQSHDREAKAGRHLAGAGHDGLLYFWRQIEDVNDESKSVFHPGAQILPSAGRELYHELATSASYTSAQSPEPPWSQRVLAGSLALTINPVKVRPFALLAVADCLDAVVIARGFGGSGVGVPGDAAAGVRHEDQQCILP